MGLADRFRAIRDLGVDGLEIDDARRLRTINVITLTATIFTGSYGILYALYDAGSLLKAVGFLVLIAFLYPTIFLFSRHGQVDGATRMLLAVGLFHLVFVSWLLGPASGALNYLVVIPFFLTMVISHRDNLLALASSAIASAAIIAITFWGPTDGVAGLPPEFSDILFIINVFGAILLALGVGLFFRWLIRRAEEGLVAERARSDRLLRAILPEAIAERLKDAPGVIAEQAEATVLFADIAGFTRWASGRAPEQIVAELNRVFGHIDDLAAAHGVEKIKTIGDCYMAVTGAPTPAPDHARRMAGFALALQAAVPGWRTADWPDLAFRVGLHSGPVAAGVIGRAKFAYDVWGDTVNVAARAEETSAPGDIVVTEAVRAALGGEAQTAPLGETELRGKGAMALYRLTALD